MTNTPFLTKAVALAVLASLVLTWQVHGRLDDETFVCQSGERCELGSGLSWLLTGVALTGPFIAVLGAAWTRHLHQRDRLGPFSSRVIPDGEQIIEVLAVLVVGLVSYWLIGNGPQIEAVVTKVGRPNSWILDAREIADESSTNKLVPNRANWFTIGMLLGAPFAFSSGSMLAREWYGRLRRQAQSEADTKLGEVDIDLTIIDLTDSTTQTHVDDR